jgi:hypothetical protein
MPDMRSFATWFLYARIDDVFRRGLAPYPGGRPALCVRLSDLGKYNQDRYMLHHIVHMLLDMQDLFDLYYVQV